MDEILSALACIPVRTCSYAEWLGIGMALKDAGYECAVWDDWSRDDKRYVEGDCARRWATFKGSDRPITVRTIRAMARKNGWVSAFTDFEDTRSLRPRRRSSAIWKPCFSRMSSSVLPRKSSPTTTASSSPSTPTSP